MIGYITLGTNDLERAARFYDALMAEMGAQRVDTSERHVYYGKRLGPSMLAVVKPYDGRAATVGNGTMVALGLRSRSDVERVHAKALSLGAADEGAPGYRGERFYGAYFRDLDGNKLCVFTWEAQGAST